MSGVFTSDPYIEPDWSGKGQTVYNMDMEPDVVIDSEVHQILTTREIETVIPEFDWTGSHSGILLQPEFAVKLEKLWKAFLFGHLEMFKVHAWWRRYAPQYSKPESDGTDKDEQSGVYSFTPDGKIRIESVVFEIEVEGDTLNEAKELFIERLRAQNYTGEIHFFYEMIDDEKNQELFDRAVELAFSKHRNQTDKAGKKYITHIIRVCEKCLSDEERIVALLHDTIEDTDVTVEMLDTLGFPIDIINAVLSVTKIKGEEYQDFVKRAGMNKIGRYVKIADLEDNMTVQRLNEVTGDDVERLNKYIKAWRYLKQIISESNN